MQVVSQVIEQVMTNAVRLQLAIDETSSKINAMGSFKILDTLIATVGRGIGLIVALIALGAVKKLTAVFLVLGAGKWSEVLVSVITLTTPGLIHMFFTVGWPAITRYLLGNVLTNDVAETSISPATTVGAILRLSPDLAPSLKILAMFTSVTLILIILTVAMARVVRSFPWNARVLPLSSVVHGVELRDHTWTSEKQFQSANP